MVIALERPHLNELVCMVVQVAHPDRVVLFGSTARGDSRRNSETDLPVILSGARWALEGRIDVGLVGIPPGVDGGGSPPLGW